MASIPTTRLLEVAVEAARKAATVIAAERAAGRNAVDHEKFSPQDIVTAADVAAQTAIYETVKAAFPEGIADGSVQMLGEESVEPGSEASAAAIARLSASDVLFVVDPLDGTTMFAHDVPLYTVSIGVAVKGEVVAGVVYEPNRNEMFSGAKGQGAFLNGVPIRVSPEPKMRNTLWAFGLHSAPAVTVTMLRALTGLTQVSRGCRCLGSAALHLAYVAAGRFTGFTELDLNSWDLAAGALLVAEAGGRVTDTRGEAYTLHTRDILASNGQEEVHEGCRVVLQTMGADRPDTAEKYAAAGTPVAQAALQAWAAGRGAGAAAAAAGK